MKKGCCLQLQGASHIFTLQEVIADSSFENNNHQRMMSFLPYQNNQIEQDGYKSQIKKNVWASMKQNYQNNPRSYALYLTFRQRQHILLKHRDDSQLNEFCIRLPTLHTLYQGQISKQLNEKISSSDLKKRKNRKNTIFVENFRYRFYQRSGQFGSFYYPLSKKEAAEEAFCFYSLQPCAGQPILKNLKTFENYNDYQRYFQRPTTELLQQLKLLSQNEEEQKYCIFCIFHQEKQKNIIDKAYLNIYEFTGIEWVMTEKVMLGNSMHLQQKNKDTTKLNKIDESCTAICQKYQNSIFVIQKQKWQSNLDLQYILKKLCKKLTFHFAPMPKSQMGGLVNMKSHYLIRFYLKENEQFFLIVHNNQAIIQQFITKLEYIQDNSIPHQNKKMLLKQIEKLSVINRLRYPFDYYESVYKMFSQLVHLLRSKRESDKFGIMLSLLKDFISEQKFRLCQYLLIQNISSLEFVSFITSSSLQKQPTRNLFEKIMCNIEALGQSIVSFNSTSLTVLIYWALGPPGTEKTQIYGQLEKQFNKYSVKCITIPSFSQLSSSFFYFLQSGQLFQQERFAVCFVEDYFSPERYHQILQILCQIPNNIFYSLILVTPETKSPMTVFSEVNNHLHLKQNLNNIPYGQDKGSSIKTHYYFSIQFLLAVILNIQKRPHSHSRLHGQGVESLAKVLHYISSIYTNLDLQQLVENSGVYGGQVRILEYKTLERVKIDWSDVNEYEQEQISDQLRLLLEGSYKKIIEEDVLLFYFLENIERIDYQFITSDIGYQILNLTFQSVPYLQQLGNSSTNGTST